MFKQGISVLLFLAYAIADVPVSGQIYSDNGNPLAYAVITSGMNSNWVIADENGHFNYPFSAVIGDTLNISRYGYQQGDLVISGRSFYVISLHPVPIQQKDITVFGENQYFHGQMINTYQTLNGNANPQNIFQQISGIAIRSYGGKAGIMTLSTNGGPAVNTKIILDDIDLTSAQNGETDLSQLPEKFFNQVTVAKSPGIFYGSGAVDGVMRISSQNQQSSFSASFGSFGFNSLSGNFNQNWNNWSANLSAGYLNDDGNFNYTIEDSSFTRENNDFKRMYVALKAVGLLSERSNISVQLLGSQQDRGVAGTVSWASPEARRDGRAYWLSRWH